MSDTPRFHVVTVGKYLDGPERIRAIKAYMVADHDRANHTVSVKYDTVEGAQAFADRLNIRPEDRERMTLAEWDILQPWPTTSNPHPYTASCFHEATNRRYVHDVPQIAHRSMLWLLSDFRVETVQAGVIWLQLR